MYHRNPGLSIPGNEKSSSLCREEEKLRGFIYLYCVGGIWLPIEFQTLETFKTELL